MTEDSKAPWHLWVAGVLTMIFNLGGVADYVGTHAFPQQYLASFEPDAREYFQNFPAWQVGFWALGVWGAFAASILLLLRNRFAFHASAISLIGLLVVTVLQYTQGLPASIDVPFVNVFNAVIWAVQIFILLYAKRQTATGVLR